MTTLRHAAVRADPLEPCPFCGCGLALAQHNRPRRRQNRRTPYQLTPIPLAELPEWWQAIIRALNAPPIRRDPTDADRRYVAALNARAGWRAIVDAKTNKITAWENPDTGERQVAA